MKDNIFLIHSLENGWSCPDIHGEDDAQLYCLEELEVPKEHIEDVRCYNEAFQLTLKRQKAYPNDDWYVNLIRCA